MPVVPFWTSPGSHDDNAVGVLYKDVYVEKLQGSIPRRGGQEGSSATSASPKTIPCDFIMEVRKNDKTYQEDSCATFVWNQKYQDGSTAPVVMFAVADGHSNRNASYAFASAKSTEDGGALGQMVTERMRNAFQAVLEDFPSDCWSTQEEILSKRLEDQGATVDESIERVDWA